MKNLIGFTTVILLMKDTMLYHPTTHWRLGCIAIDQRKLGIYSYQRQCVTFIGQLRCNPNL